MPRDAPVRRCSVACPPGWGHVRAGRREAGAVEITGVAEDSRRVQPGSLFLARKGRGTDGHRYIAPALAAGAVAVAGELPPAELPAPLPPVCPTSRSSEGHTAFALLSAAFYGFPSRKMAMVGVTGTDGKTTTSTLVHSILTAAGRRTGLITTISRADRRPGARHRLPRHHARSVRPAGLPGADGRGRLQGGGGRNHLARRWIRRAWPMWIMTWRW